MKILITGGMGFLGSHTCLALLNAGHEIVIADNLSNSRYTVLENIEKLTNKKVYFYEIDVTKKKDVFEIFKIHRIDGVIHFAGYKSVAESVDLPLDYYYNNLVSTIILAKACKQFNVKRFVFSSTATVYGSNNISPIPETTNILETNNPYGETKSMCERILKDLSNTNPNFSVSILRYFNPIGADESGLIGEEPRGTPNNIMPYIMQVASGKISKLQVFGNSYPTIDGTGVRDYIHVSDLAEGHVTVLENMSNGVDIFNLGTGKGTSVLELITTFELVNGVKVPYEIVDRRQGDIGICFADVTKIEKEFGWTAKRNLKDMCRDSWEFEMKNSSM